MALTEAANNVIYLKEFFAEIELRYLPPITIFNDNLGAQLLSMNAIVHPRTKHIDIRYHFIRDVLRTGTSVQHMKTEDMLADILTKSLTKDKHYFCLRHLNLKPCLN